MTSLSEEQADRVRALGLDPVGLCAVVQGLIVQPEDAFGAGLSAERMAERNTRPARALMSRLADLDPLPLGEARSEEHRVIGTCRHVAVLATAFLQATGVPARARCGFATYFVPHRKVDHWITEYWSDTGRRWTRIDAEILGSDQVDDPRDLSEGAFLSGGEAWQRVRLGGDDPMSYGVDGTDHWGPGEIRANAIRDLAALHQVEMLPWDVWGPMADSYQGTTGGGFDRVIDDVADACAAEDRDAMRALYAHLAVPPDLIG